MKPAPFPRKWGPGWPVTVVLGLQVPATLKVPTWLLLRQSL